MARRTETSHRHTVPNSSYDTFPCYEEELKLKTNLMKCDSDQSQTGDNNLKNIQVNVSMHDKLQMRFTDMESMKDQFDIRRRKLTPKKRVADCSQSIKSTIKSQVSTANLQPIPSENVTSKEETENKFKAHLIRTNSKDSLENLQTGTTTTDTEHASSSKSFEVLSRSPAYEEDYVDSTKVVGQTPNIATKEHNVFTRLNLNRRPMSDPYAEIGKGTMADGTVGHRKSIYQEQDSFGLNREGFKLCPEKEDSSTTIRSKDLETRRSYDKWLQKLDEVNDISRSTLKRIKHLEHEVCSLKMATDTIPSSTSRQSNTKGLTSKIPITTGPTFSYGTNIPLNASNTSFTTTMAKRYADKSTNTEIDFKFMDELLARWKSTEKSKIMFDYNRTDVNSYGEATTTTNNKPAHRRLTTTLGRSVEIQTDLKQTVCHEKAISTEDWLPPSPPPPPSPSFSPSPLSATTTQPQPSSSWPPPPPPPPPPQSSPPPRAPSTSFPVDHQLKLAQSSSVGKTTSSQQSSEISILDLPNVEFPPPMSSTMSHFNRWNRKETRQKTPEPIIDIYSDSEDNNFDAFEKNIYKEISRRALVQNRFMNRKQGPTTIPKDHSKYQHSSTQTNAFEAKKVEVENEQDSTPTNVTSHMPSTEMAQTLPKNLQSTSKIIIERVRSNQKEKSEIVLKTDIDKEGVVHRSTEVKNRKYKPRVQCSNVQQNPVVQSVNSPMKHRRKVHSDMSMSQSGSLQRPLSAFDISNSRLAKKKADQYIGEKALSSIDITAKSPVSEGYHSEFLDSNQRIHTASPTEITDANLVAELIIDPPNRFQNEPEWEEISKSEVTNKVVNENANAFKELHAKQSGLLTLTNETVIDNNGKETNITTRSRTIRKYDQKDKTKFTLDLQSKSNQDSARGSSVDLSRSRSTSQCCLDESSLLPVCRDEPTLYYREQLMRPSVNEVLTLLPSQQNPPASVHNADRSLQHRYPQCSQNLMNTSQDQDDNQPTMCNLSFVYNYGNNVVLRANFGLAKLPLFETNL